MQLELPQDSGRLERLSERVFTILVFQELKEKLPCKSGMASPVGTLCRSQPQYVGHFQKPEQGVIELDCFLNFQRLADMTCHNFHQSGGFGLELELVLASLIIQETLVTCHGQD